MTLIVVLSAAMFSRRNLTRYGVDTLRQRGCDMVCLDVSDILTPGVRRDRDHYPELQQDLDLRHIRSVAQLMDLVPELAKADLVLEFAVSGHLTRRHWPILRFLAKIGVPYLIQVSNAFPGWRRYAGDHGSWRQKLRDVAKRLGEIRPIDSALARIPPKWLGLPSAEFVVVGGRQCTGYSRFVNQHTRTIQAHAMDYENYRRVADLRLAPSNTAVFIDEFLPYHPDIAMMGLDAPMEAGAYYAALNALFDRVERELGLEVVIAACPLADYDRRPGLFGSRRVEMSRTAELTAQARLVIAHRSTAINYAVLFRKPLILTATQDTYRHSSQTPYLDGFARALDKEIQFFDRAEGVDLSDPFGVDEIIYGRYAEDYIKQLPSPDKPYWDIVIDEINASGFARL